MGTSRRKTMEVGDRVRFNEEMAGPNVGTTTPTAIVLKTWTEAQSSPFDHIEEQWCEVVWSSGRRAELLAVLFEVVNGRSS